MTIAPDDETALRLIAHRTWLFFETFVGAGDNGLPPDNFQEDPVPVVAHRTSPTNIGLYLLSIVAARDFGWVGTFDALERIDAVFVSLNKMQRFRGHFYNWYNTSTLEVLEPQYVSSVDSGNLAGHLIVLKSAMSEYANDPLISPNWAVALVNALTTLRQSAAGMTKSQSTNALHAAALALANSLKDPPQGLMNIIDRLNEVDGFCGDVLVRARACGDESSEVVIWAQALAQTAQGLLRDAALVAPWTALLTKEGFADSASGVLFNVMPSLNQLPAHCEAIRELMSRPDAVISNAGRTDLLRALATSALAARSLVGRLEARASEAMNLFTKMEFGFLFDSNRQLLSIGYRGSDGSLDANAYDLLASEARLASYVAIAKGDVPAKHWFRLGRAHTEVDHGSALMSWSGSMFEYLMPLLVMHAPQESLLAQTERLVVSRQKEYGGELDVPWGISESAYNARDLDNNYQYSSFGVPDLGYKRGLADSVVVAPYATALACMVDPVAAVRNFNRLTELGGRGAYGWYEAFDFTRARLPVGKTFVIIRAYMAHHQGMTIVAIANAVQDGRMRARFHVEPIIRAAELLLQERAPQDLALAKPSLQFDSASTQGAALAPEVQRRYVGSHSRSPRTHLLSNGKYSTMITAAGSGYSRWRDISITRWREDATLDNWGSYIFVRDSTSAAIWSAGYQPTKFEPDDYVATFSEDGAQITRKDGGFSTTLELIVSPEDDGEVRRISVTNHSAVPREIEVTSYAELSLARHADDVAAMAFAKLFVETEFVPELGAILATRRQRSSADPLVWAVHIAVVEGEDSGVMQFETDRARFLGRGQTAQSPAAISEGWPLANTVGTVLDPIFSLRRHLRIPRGGTVRIAFWTLAAESREGALDLADKHRDANAFERVKTLAWTRAQMELRHLGVLTEDAHLFQRLANLILYSSAALRPASASIATGLARAATLWDKGVSGDLPILLLRVEEGDDLELVRLLLRGHEYWRMKQLAVDLVILNDQASSYVQAFQTSLEALVRMNRPTSGTSGGEKPGAVFTLRADLCSPELLALLPACARAIVYGSRGSLAAQMDRIDESPSARTPKVAHPPRPDSDLESLPLPEVEFFNGLGGFAKQGREYVTRLVDGSHTPAPWVNVVANAEFGFQASTEGAGFTWSLNSQQNQLTPWSNDPVGDGCGEAIYVRDDETGALWGPTALPIREKTAPYLAAHGQGYCRFEHVSKEISLSYVQFVPLSDPIKISRLQIKNLSSRPRRLSITAYVEWALGANRAAEAPFIATRSDPETKAIFAQSRWNASFGDRVAFMDLGGRQSAWTGDRAEFLGRTGALSQPSGLSADFKLSNRLGAGLDPCGALQTQVTLAAGGSSEVVFCLGQAADADKSRALVVKYRNADLDAEFAAVTGMWDAMLSTVQVKTPDRALDIVVNRWLPYQTLACRVWARAGFYQASGAYGFRDQLQDVMSLCVLRPDIAREHLIRAAGRQFVEGDVQHWWLPHSGSGIRTRIADDRIWLALVAAHYVQTTGDIGILSETVAFLEGALLEPAQHDRFFEPTISDKCGTLFEHCALALDTSLEFGAHGLPLMRAGDWNDGMDRVGQGGKGESVWLGWFLITALEAFSELAERVGKAARVPAWRTVAETLKASIDSEAWDGDWFRRAFYDDGAPLGSVANNECRIDSIAQSWAVISGGAAPARGKRALEALDKYLVRRDARLSLLFTPPFNHPNRDPGYIKGYPPGVRENGGQYTHGAVWAALAFAMQGDGDKAGELLAMLNPIRNALTPNDVQRYKVEPFVACADVYSEPPHVGRGGWTWYTGSAGWMYRVTVEYLLGFRVLGDHLRLDPCIPKAWPGFEIVYRHGGTRYEISVDNTLGVSRGILAIRLDGEMLKDCPSGSIPLLDDGLTHSVRVVLGP